jgi:hypothetical protein
MLPDMTPLFSVHVACTTAGLLMPACQLFHRLDGALPRWQLLNHAQLLKHTYQYEGFTPQQLRMLLVSLGALS